MPSMQDEYIPQAGYAHVTSVFWDIAYDDEWETEVVSPQSFLSCRFMGTRRIDGTRCAVFEATMDGGVIRYVAQTCTMCQTKGR